MIRAVAAASRSFLSRCSAKDCARPKISSSASSDSRSFRAAGAASLSRTAEYSPGAAVARSPIALSQASP